jgi:hypothetical protein
MLLCGVRTFLSDKIGTIRRSAFAKVVFFGANPAIRFNLFYLVPKNEIKKDFHYYRGYGISIQNKFLLKKHQKKIIKKNT